MRLGPLLGACGLAAPAGAADLEVARIVYDSRKAGAGSLFVAIPGFHRDGAQFAADAVARGAVAVVAEGELGGLSAPVAVTEDARASLADLAAELYDHPTARLRVVGVTGTDGKTTTTHLISDVLEAAGETTGYATTVDFKSAGQSWSNDSRQSTQEAVEVQEFCAELLVAGGTWAVLEATSHALALQKLRGTWVDVAVFTNLSPEHLDFHGTLQRYLEAKGLLFEALADGPAKGVEKAAVLNADDPHWRYLADRVAGARVITYGLNALADVQGTVLSADAKGSRIQIATGSERIEFFLPLVGRFNIANALAAAATGLATGATLAHARTALERARAVRGRMERVAEGQPFTVIVDYAHTPEALGNVLALLRPLTPGRLIAVFGSAGERDRAKRPLLAQAAGRHADLFIITEEDPRLEDPKVILAEIAAGAREAGKRLGTDYLVIGDRVAAVTSAIGQAKAGDTVLLAGKGHERSIITGEVARPYDEAATARDALRALGHAKS